MAKRNTVIAIITIISLICVIFPLVTRISYESSHNSFEVATVLTPEMTEEELVFLKENDINLLVADEKDSSFDLSQISLAKELGFDIALRINVGEKCADGFEDELNSLVRENGIKYMLISENKDEKSFDAPLDKVIEKNDMTVVLCETVKQLSNKMPQGYERYLDAADGRIMRSYETLKDPARSLNSSDSTDSIGELLYHHMSNSIRDRNTEFMVLNIIDNPSLPRDAEMKETVYAAAKFKENAIRSGYKEGKDISLKGYTNDVRIPTCGSVMLACVMALASIEILLKKRSPLTEWIFCIVAAASFAIVYFMPQKLLLVVPSAFAPLSAVFSFSASVGVAKYVKNKGCSLILSLLTVTASALVFLSVGAMALGAMLSGTDYYLNNLVFRGVKLSLILPVIYAFVFMWIYENQKFNISSKSIRETFSKIKLTHIIVLVVAAIAVFVYVLRSGNAKISPFENAIRNFVSDISGARPRTKEFVIGWPLLALSVYLIHSSAPKLLTWISCVGSSVLFASVTNTFCHVFADFSVSALRTVNGLMFSVPVTIVVLLIAKLSGVSRK